MRSILRKLLIFPPIILALLAASWMNDRPTVSAQEKEEIAVPVRSLTVVPTTVAARASGFGRVETTRTWSGVAEVEGRLVTYDDGLQVGAMVEAGDLLFEIDARDYEIAVAQREADVLRAQADIQELQVNAANTRASLDVERQILEIYRADRDRVAGLVDRGSVAATELESSNRTFLSQQSVVTSLEASLALADPDLASAEAALAKTRADLESAERDLARTRVVSPIDGRVSLRGASVSEYVRPGDVLVTVEAVETVEIEAAFQPADLVQLIGAVSVAQLAGIQGAGLSEINLANTLGRSLEAEVTSQIGGAFPRMSWSATISRITGRIDVETGAIGIVVQVRNTPPSLEPTVSPPLVSGAFVEVTISGPPEGNVLLIPERALRYEAGKTYLYVADADDRLARIDVTTGPAFDGSVSILDGLSAGDRVILSDPSPATSGLLLDVIESGAEQP